MTSSMMVRSCSEVSFMDDIYHPRGVTPRSALPEEPEELLGGRGSEDEAEEGGEGGGLLVEHRGLLCDVVDE